MQSLSNVGTFAVGATVEAQREDGDDEYEPATVKGFDPKSATLSLLFADGFKAGGVPLSRVKLEQGTVEPPPPAAAPRRSLLDSMGSTWRRLTKLIGWGPRPKPNLDGDVRVTRVDAATLLRPL